MSRLPADRMRSAAVVFWVAAAATYLSSEAAAAFAFTPAYDYATNYISDLGVPACGIVYAGRRICSPLHALVDAGFVMQGLFFVAAALAASRVPSVRLRWLLVACAALNGIGIAIVGLVPETSPARITNALTVHGLGALLAIVFGNATALVSVPTFRELGLPRAYRLASLVLPLGAATALALLLAGWRVWPAGALERASVYTITAWELMSAFYLSKRATQ